MQRFTFQRGVKIITGGRDEFTDWLHHIQSVSCTKVASKQRNMSNNSMYEESIACRSNAIDNIGVSERHFEAQWDVKTTSVYTCF